MICQGKKEKRRQPYSSISIPTRLLKEIEKLVKEIGYWPTKTAFIREACLEKLEKHKKELEARRLIEG
ncbi:MAG: ribbon-helix-helix domain-containing protein [Candidatus Bathyarchaeia archaeon]